MPWQMYSGLKPVPYAAYSFCNQQRLLFHTMAAAAFIGYSISRYYPMRLLLYSHLIALLHIENYKCAGNL